MKKYIRAYDYYVLDDLVNYYKSCDYSSSEVWDRVYNDFEDEALADDVVEAIYGSKSLKSQKIISSKTSFKNTPEFLDQLRREFEGKAKNFVNILWGGGADDYVHVDVEYHENYYDDGTSDAISVEVRAELGYEDLVDLARYLDKSIVKYCSDAYFEPVTSGILQAWIWEE